MQKLLITGASGLLGSNLIRLLKDKFDITGISRNGHKPFYGIEIIKLDIIDEIKVTKFLSRNKFDIIIHCAALVSPDLCEQNPDLSYSINALGTSNLVKNHSGIFVYISTDMLFDGKKENYSEEDIPSPINTYGVTKLKGEQFVQKYSEKHFILRTNFFGWNLISNNQSFAEWLYFSLADNASINLFYDYIFSPIYISDFISILFKFLQASNYGIYNVVGKNAVSKYEFGILLAEQFKLNEKKINKTSIEDKHFIARRPRNMSLNTDKLKSLAFKIPEIKEGLTRFYKDKPKANTGFVIIN